MPFVVDDDGDARVAFAVAGLVHADRVQAVERRRHRRLQPFGDPTGDVSGGAPRDVRKTAHGPLVRDAHRPRAFRFEIACEPAARARPTARKRPRRRTVGGPRGASRRPARLAGSRSPDRASDARAALVMPAAPPSALGASEHAPARAHPDLEHGFGTQRRIRDPHILCNHAFDVRQSGEQAFAQALFAIHFFGRKTEYAGIPLTLTKSTARRRTDIHENSNSASLYSLQGRYLFSDALPPMVICLTVMVVVTRFEFRMPLFIGLSLFTFDLYQWHIVLLRVLAP